MIGRMIRDRLAALEPRFSPMAFRATLIGMLLAAFAIPLALAAIPYLAMFNDMAVQPKGKTDALYGTTLGQPAVVNRLPAAGTLPMDYRPYGFWGPRDAAGEPATLTVEQAEALAKEAGAALTNPLRPTMVVLLRGQKIFQDYCRTCHGDEGLGNGPIVGPNLFPAPPSLHTDTARAFPDGRMFHVITRGQNVMPSYADKLNDTDRWSVIHYVRALQRALNPKPEDVTE